MAQTPQRSLITQYSDGQVVISKIRKKRNTIPIFGANEEYSATLVTSWYDGSPMDDTKADGSVYFKLKALPQGADPSVYGQYVGSYFRVNLPKFGETFLEKDTMQAMRDLSSVEVLLLKMEYYKGVKLNGYYAKDDTPSPIEYYLSETTSLDDGGSVIVVGDIKLEHVFEDKVDVRYFGLRSGSNYVNDPQLVNNIFVNNNGKEVYFDYGTDFTMDMGTYWDNGTIQVPSNNTITINGVIRHRPSRNTNASIMLIMEVENILIKGEGTLYGYKYSRPVVGLDETYYKMYKVGESYVVGDYVAYNAYGYRVTQAGQGTSIPTPAPTSSTPMGTVFNMGGNLLLELVEGGLGEWGYGIYNYASKNVVISGLTFKEFWGDGMAFGGRERVTGALVPCDNYTVKNVIIEDCRRQGASIANMVDSVFDNCSFVKTYGTLPMAGVDLEINPDDSTSAKIGVVNNVKFNNCVFDQNNQGLLILSPYQDPSRMTDIYLNNCAFKNNREWNITINKVGKVVINNPVVYSNTVGASGGEINLGAEEVEINNMTYISGNVNNNVAIFNLNNYFTDKTKVKSYIFNNLQIVNKGNTKNLFTYQNNHDSLTLKIDKSNIDIGNKGFLNTQNVTDIGIFKVSKSSIACAGGYVTNKTNTRGRLEITDTDFDVYANSAASSQPFFITGGHMSKAEFINIKFTNKDTNNSEFVLLDINNSGDTTGISRVYSLVKNVSFIGFTRTSTELIKTYGGSTTTPTYTISNVDFIDCDVPHLISSDITRHSIVKFEKNNTNRATSNTPVKINGTGTPRTGWRFNANNNTLLYSSDVIGVEGVVSSYVNIFSNIINNKFMIRELKTYNQSAYSADTATVASGANPTKAEFDALLAEFRDFKTKSRTSGQSATS